MIVITGASGFIGNVLLRRYAETERFVCLTRGDAAKTLYKHPHVEWKQTDYQKDLSDLLQGASAVVHLAGRKADAKAEGVLAYRDNYELTEQLFSACRNAGIQNVVYLSSRCVYSEKNSLPYREEETPRPLNLYGLSKRMGELVADYYCEQYGMKIKSLRLSQVFGVGTNNAPLIFLKNASKGVPIYLYGQGKSVRDYLYVKDAVRAVMSAAKRPFCQGIYNIGAGKAVSYLELAKAATAVFGREDLIHFLPEKPDDPVNVQLDCRKVEKDWGFVSRYSILEAFYDIEREAKGSL